MIKEFVVDGHKFWATDEYIEQMTQMFKERDRDISRRVLFPELYKDEVKGESFYFVHLSNGKGSATGMKSRLTGRIFLCDDNYEPDITKPIESTEYKYVRDCTSMDM